MGNLVMRQLLMIAGSVAVLFVAGCTASASHPSASPAPLPPDPHTAAALLKIAAAFNHDYDTGRYGPVYARWDARTQAILARADSLRRHKDCPPASHALSQTVNVSPGGPRGPGLGHSQAGGHPTAPDSVAALPRRVPPHPL